MLDKRGLTDGTLIAYVCDNGWIQWSGKRLGFDALRGKRTPYEGGVRTPIMLRWPGRIKPRRDEKTLASSIDLVPTILAACGLAPTAEMPGVDLLDAAALAERKAVFGAAFDHDVEDINDPVKSLNTRWCIEGQWKLLVHQMPEGRKGKVELYDVLADPHEKTDLAARHPDKVRRLRKLIDDWWPAREGQ